LIEPYTGAKDHSAFLKMTPQQRMASFWGLESLPSEFSADVEWRVESGTQHVDRFLYQLAGISDLVLIVTEQDYTGLATRDAYVGAVICLVAGCPQPTLIRPSCESYKVVGESFIFGMMDNELVKNGNLTEENQQMFDFI